MSAWSGRAPPARGCDHMLRRARHHQHAARRMRHHVAHHLADQQVGQQAALAAPADHDQVGVALARLVDDLAVGLRPAPRLQLERRRRRAAHRPAAPAGAAPASRLGVRGQLRRQRLVLRVADDRQHARPAAGRSAAPSRRPAPRRRRPAPSARWPAAGARRHASWPSLLQWPAVSTPEAASSSTAICASAEADVDAVAAPRVQRQQRPAGASSEQPASSAMPSRSAMSPRCACASQPQPVGSAGGDEEFAHRQVPQLGQARVRHMRRGQPQARRRGRPAPARPGRRACPSRASARSATARPAA